MTKKSFDIFYISSNHPNEKSTATTTALEATEKELKDVESYQPESSGKWRDLVSYWIFGLCNNFGYVVMLTAAHSIIKEISGGESQKGDGDRPCNLVSTGTILLADVIPGLCIKFLSPFLPFWHRIRISISCTIAIGGFIVVAYASEEWQALAGVAMTSFASGLGEPTFLAMSAFYDKNVISTWSSGTGGAGIIGALAYTLLKRLGLSNQQTLLVMVVVPALEFLVFLFLLRKPASNRIEDQHKGDDVVDNLPTFKSFSEKIIYIKSLIHFMIPLCLVYVFEYLINQGLFEMVYFPNTFLEHEEQYQWYQVTYQIGVFISRSSVNIVQFKRIWIMAVLQGLNLIFFGFEAVIMFTPSIWIIFALIIFEGLLGGGSYVNTFYRMTKEIPATRREFAMSVVTLSDSLGITLAGFLAMPTHNYICGLPGGWRLQ